MTPTIEEFMHLTDHPADKLLLTLKQAAAMLTFSKRKLERMIAARDFPRPLKIGRASRVLPEDVQDYIERLRKKRDDDKGGRP